MNTYGAIAIESESVKLKIVEEKKSGYRTLEDISVNINLERDLIHEGRILRSSVSELMECLKSYKKVLKEYGAEKYRVAATGIFRKAPNGRFIVDLLSKKLKMKIYLIEEPVERFLTYLSLNKKMEDYDRIRDEGMLFVEVGSTSSELMVFRKTKIIVSSQIPVGVMNLKALSKSMGRISGDMTEILSEYVSGVSENLHKYINRKKIKHYIAYGSNMYKLMKHMGHSEEIIDKSVILNMEKKLLEGDVEFKEYVESLHMDYDALTCEAIILKHFYTFVQNADVHVPEVSLRDGLIYAMVEKIEKYPRNSEITKDIISCTRQVAKRYNATARHINRVENNFIKLFDAYKSLENFSEKDLMIGRMTCILHELGKFSRQMDYYEATYKNIVNINLLGVGTKILKEVANTALNLFYFTRDATINKELDFADEKNIKLGLLIALADAMDKSKKQNLQLIKAKVSGDKLRLNVSTNENCYLEMWEIDQLKDFFLDVLGHEIIVTK